MCKDEGSHETADMILVARDRWLIKLRRPFPPMLDVLGKPNAPVPFIMPARILPPGPTERIRHIVGSGPFVFDPSGWRPGDTMTLKRHEKYIPRTEPGDFLAGGKVVRIDELILKTMPDDATGASALLAGEIDYMQFPPFDLMGRLKSTPEVSVMRLSGVDAFQGNFRLNHASGPFADPAVRRVLWHLVDQEETLRAIGVPEAFRVRDCPSFFMCGGPLERPDGTEAATFSIDAARTALRATSYNGEPVVMLLVAGSISQTAGYVLAAHMREAGFTVQTEIMDWGTVLARRAKKVGWSLFPVFSNGIDMASPLTHFYVANNCADFPGWSCDRNMTSLLSAFVAAPDRETRARIAGALQAIAYRLVPSVMWGQFSRPAAYRTRLKEMPVSSFPMFWDVSV